MSLEELKKIPPDTVKDALKELSKKVGMNKIYIILLSLIFITASNASDLDSKITGTLNNFILH